MHVIREIKESGQTGWKGGKRFYYSYFLKNIKGILKGNYFIFSFMNLIAQRDLNASKLRFSRGIGGIKGIHSKVSIFLLICILC